MRNGLIEAEALHQSLRQHELPDLMAEAAQGLQGHGELIDLLDQALVAEPPLMVRDGGFIAPGFDSDPDGARAPVSSTHPPLPPQTTLSISQAYRVLQKTT